MVVSSRQPEPAVWCRIAIAVCGGLLIAAAFPPVNVPFVLPVAIALLLGATIDLRTRHAFYAGLLAGMVCYLATLHWLANLFGPAVVPLCAILAFFIGVFCALMTWLHRRLPGIPLWLLTPVVWVALEFYRSEPFVLRFGWIAPAYGVARFPAFGWLASLLGSYGVSLLIVAIGAALLRLWPSRRQAACVLLAAWLGLFFLPGRQVALDRPVLARLVQANCEDLPELIARSNRGDGPRADVTLWPEYSFLSDPVREPQTLRKLQATARANATWLVFGGKDSMDPAAEDRWRNTAYVLSPEGDVLGRHVKVHTVHFINDGVAGTAVRSIPTGVGNLGIAICFDMDYPDVARRLVEDGAEVFLVPNMDPAEWGPIQREQHRSLFAMRAAECGRWLARADVAGGTSAYAPYGREVARVRTSDPTRLDVMLGRSRIRTPYVRYGWLLPRVCLAALGIMVLLASIGLRRRSPA